MNIPQLFKIGVLAILHLNLVGAQEGEEEKLWSFYGVDGKHQQASVDQIGNNGVTLSPKSDEKQRFVQLEKFDKKTQLLIHVLRTARAKDVSNLDRPFYPISLMEMACGIEAINCRAEKQAREFSRDQINALARINSYRYLVGIPQEMTLDKTWCDIALTAAKHCSDRNVLSHRLSGATAKCSLYYSSRRLSLIDFVNGWMTDPGRNNEMMRGHRQICLDLRLSKFGIGQRGSYAAMYGIPLNSTRLGKGPQLESSFAAYPSAGFFPTSMIEDGAGWSVIFDREQHRPGGKILNTPQRSDVSIKVYDVKNRDVSFLTNGTVPTNLKPLMVTKTYVTSGSKNGIGPCINFVPSAKISPGNRYVVMIQGALEARYVVELF